MAPESVWDVCMFGAIVRSGWRNRPVTRVVIFRVAERARAGLDAATDDYRYIYSRAFAGCSGACALSCLSAPSGKRRDQSFSLKQPPAP